MKNTPSAKTVKKQAGKPVAALPKKDNTVWLLGVVLLLTGIAYIPALKAGFVNWDDPIYVQENPMIRSFANFKALLTEPVSGNYHPLTMLSLALNYAISGEKAWSYHLFNVLLHLVNTFLVFRFAEKLSKGNSLISLTTALLFALHPMHVESVAWVSERKDVLYTFFFLLGLIRYTGYLDSESRKDYLLAILFFALSLTAKPAAVIFPIILFLVDFFRQRKFSLTLALDKVPFLALSLILGLLTMSAQKSAGATAVIEYFSTGNRILFGFYGYLMYFGKMLLPIHLVTFYPFPTINTPLPSIYWASPVFFLLTAALCLFTWKKYPVITFGFGFYLLNLILVLQIIPVGSAIISERYTYVPYIGLFFVLGWLLDRQLAKKQTVAYTALFAVGLILTGMSYMQASTWKSGETLWDHAIEHQPSTYAYNNRARLLRQEGNVEKALAYYTESLKISAISEEALNNRGRIYFDQGKDALALADLNEALRLKPDYATALDNRGALYGKQGKLDLAVADFEHAIRVKPDYAPPYKNRAVAYMNQNDPAGAAVVLEKYLSLTLKPTADELAFLGQCYQAAQKYDLALKAFDSAIRVQEAPKFFLFRSEAWHALANDDAARKDVLLAQKGGIQVPEAYLRALGINP